MSAADLDRSRELLAWLRAHLEDLHGPARKHPHTAQIERRT